MDFNINTNFNLKLNIMKSKLIESMLTKDMVTENDMPTNSSSLDSLVDLFFVVGAMRKEAKTGEGKSRLLQKFEAAFSQDPLIATKIMFWARNARGGAGEREVFKVVMKHLAESKKSAALKNIKHIPEFGRFDDLFVFIGTPFEDEALDVYVNALKSGEYAQNLLSKIDTLSEDECKKILLTL